MADRSRTSQRQQMAPGTLAVFKAAGHQFGAPASLWGWFSRFGARRDERLINPKSVSHSMLRGAVYARLDRWFFLRFKYTLCDFKTVIDVRVTYHFHGAKANRGRNSLAQDGYVLYDLLASHTNADPF